MASYKEFHKRSIEDRDGFWGEQAQLIHWNKQPAQIYDFSNPPFVKWFVGGETNLCYNAVDRHAETHPDREIARGLPEEAVAIATRRIAAINAAWDAIQKERGMSRNLAPEPA